MQIAVWVPTLCQQPKHGVQGAVRRLSALTSVDAEVLLSVVWADTGLSSEAEQHIPL